MLRAVVLDKSYILKHWGATLATAPFLPALWEVFFSYERGWLETLALYPLFLMFGLLFSLPALLLYYLVFELLANRHLPVSIKKLLLIGFTVLSIAVTFWLVKGSMAPTLCMAYSAAAVTCGLLFKLQKEEKAPPTIE